MECTYLAHFKVSWGFYKKSYLGS